MAVVASHVNFALAGMPSWTQEGSCSLVTQHGCTNCQESCRAWARTRGIQVVFLTSCLSDTFSDEVQEHHSQETTVAITCKGETE